MESDDLWFTAPLMFPNRSWLGVSTVIGRSSGTLLSGLPLMIVPRLDRFECFLGCLDHCLIDSHEEVHVVELNAFSQLLLQDLTTRSEFKCLNQFCSSLSSDMKVLKLSERMSVGIPLVSTKRDIAFMTAVMSWLSVTSKCTARICIHVRTNM